MEVLQIKIPQRLFYIRTSVTLGLIVSFLLSTNLWVGERMFPSSPVFSTIFISAPFDYVLFILSILFLASSLVFKNFRLFIGLSLAINIFLVLLDINRLQPWFYIYNAVLFVLLFYNGRVDNAGKYTSIFIIVQLIIASVYIFNGLNQLNSYFLQTDYYTAISPLTSVLSNRQFSFFMKAGIVVPYFIIFIGLGLIIKPLRYLSITAALVFHLALLILMFPSANNPNNALWFMNLIFAFMILFMFSGKIRESYFSTSLLFQKPLFYLIIFGFWVSPLLNYFNMGKKLPTANFRFGKTEQQNLAITPSTFEQLPLYVKHFCVKNNEGYSLKVSEWCLNELKSEYNTKTTLKPILANDIVQISGKDVKETEDELSSL